MRHYLGPGITESLQRPDPDQIAADNTMGTTSMVRLTLLLALTGLVLAPSANAQFERALADGGELLSLKNGRGYAIVTSRDGAMIANVARGRIVLRDHARGTRTEWNLYGCDRRKRVARRIICGGRDLRVTVVDGRWRVALRGRAINASAVLQGSVTLEGTAGTYAIGDPSDDDAWHPWPRSARTFSLG